MGLTALQSRLQVSQRYHAANPYHNFHHVCDVAHMLFRYMELLNECCHFTQTEKFSMLVAAVCHDLEHPGQQALMFACGCSRVHRLLLLLGSGHGADAVLTVGVR